MAYDVRGSGLRKVRRYSHEPTITIQKRKGDEPRAAPRVTAEWMVENAPEYEEGRRYTRLELTMMAEKLLREQSQTTLHCTEHPTILFADRLKDRRKREVYTTEGTPDPSLISGLYWRTHPDGRKVRSDEQRQRNGASFYR